MEFGLTQPVIELESTVFSSSSSIHSITYWLIRYLFQHHRATKTSTTNEVVLKISKCQTSDSGQYEARVFNNVGGVLVKTKIVVKGKSLAFDHYLQ